MDSGKQKKTKTRGMDSGKQKKILNLGNGLGKQLNTENSVDLFFVHAIIPLFSISFRN